MFDKLNVLELNPSIKIAPLSNSSPENEPRFLGILEKKNERRIWVFRQTMSKTQLQMDFFGNNIGNNGNNKGITHKPARH